MMKMTEQNRKYLEERLTFWDEITKEEQEVLIQNTSVVRYTQGQNIYDARQECVGVLLIKSGELRTYILSEEEKKLLSTVWVTVTYVFCPHPVF